MAKQILNIGSSANDGTGTTLRAGGDLINDNFNEIYTAFGDGSTLSSQTIPSKIGGTNFTGSLIIGHSNTGTLSNADRNVAVGINAMDAIRTGDDSVFVGHNAGTKTTTGTINTGIGSDVLFQNLVGQNNVAVGYQSLYNNTGHFNTAIGRMSGRNITSGSGNVIIGEVDAASATGDRQLKIAGYDGSTRTTWITGDNSGNLTTPAKITFTTGGVTGEAIPGIMGPASGSDYNTVQLGHANTGSSYPYNNSGRNVIVGFNASPARTSAADNVIIGWSAMQSGQGGQQNVAIGSAALKDNVSGLNVVGVGYNSLQNSTANYNTGLGANAGGNITSGAGNVMIGTVDADSATGDRQLKIAGYDGTTRTTWISGDSAGALTFANNINVGGNATITGNLTVNGTTTTVNSTEVTIQNAFVFEGATADAHETTLTVVDPTADRTITLPNESGDVIVGKKEGTNFTGSLLVGHSTTGTLNTASNNTGIGIAALDAITSGDANTAVGGNAGSAINSGLNNTAVGNAVLFNLSTGSNNTGIGKGALQQTTGSYNIGIGYTAGTNISSGDGNVIIGDVDADSATGDRQLKIAGFDGSTRTTWISGDSSGVVTATLAANTITSTQLASATTLLILDSSGSTLKTIIGAGS
tara:strand:- start:342 stop:2261 length:1920 start_codon:yes stop_codon:yes gene_type:complete